MSSILVLPGMPSRHATGDDTAAANYRRVARARAALLPLDMHPNDYSPGMARLSADLAAVARAAADLLAAARARHAEHAHAAQLVADVTPAGQAVVSPWAALIALTDPYPPPRRELVDTLTAAPTAPPARAGVPMAA